MKLLDLIFLFTCIWLAICSLSCNISWSVFIPFSKFEIIIKKSLSESLLKFFLPNMLRNVVAASKRLEYWAFSTLTTDAIGFVTRK